MPRWILGHTTLAYEVWTRNRNKLLSPPHVRLLQRQADVTGHLASPRPPDSPSVQFCLIMRGRWSRGSLRAKFEQIFVRKTTPISHMQWMQRQTFHRSPLMLDHLHDLSSVFRGSLVYELQGIVWGQRLGHVFRDCFPTLLPSNCFANSAPPTLGFPRPCPQWFHGAKCVIFHRM